MLCFSVFSKTRKAPKGQKTFPRSDFAPAELCGNGANPFRWALPIAIEYKAFSLDGSKYFKLCDMS